MKINGLPINLYCIKIIIPFFFFLSSCSNGFAFTEKYRIWEYWNSKDESSIRIVDHSKWQQILNTYLFRHQDVCLFDYDAIVADQNQSSVQEYIDILMQEDPRKLNSYEQLAYWINLYNALTVNIILSSYPVDSPLDVKPKSKLKGWWRLFSFFNYGPWNHKLVNINGRELSLNDIANRILLPIWGDRRIKYCLCNGSMGSPDLYPVVFTAMEMPKLLNNTTNRFIKQEKAIQWIDGKLVLSRLFKNPNDFHDRKDLLSHLSKYTTIKNKKKLSNFHGNIEYQFDWRLNVFP